MKLDCVIQATSSTNSFHPLNRITQNMPTFSIPFSKQVSSYLFENPEIRTEFVKSSSERHVEVSFDFKRDEVTFESNKLTLLLNAVKNFVFMTKDQDDIDCKMLVFIYPSLDRDELSIPSDGFGDVKVTLPDEMVELALSFESIRVSTTGRKRNLNTKLKWFASLPTSRDWKALLELDKLSNLERPLVLNYTIHSVNLTKGESNSSDSLATEYNVAEFGRALEEKLSLVTNPMLKELPDSLKNLPGTPTNSHSLFISGMVRRDKVWEFFEHQIWITEGETNSITLDKSAKSFMFFSPLFPKGQDLSCSILGLLEMEPWFKVWMAKVEAIIEKNASYLTNAEEEVYLPAPPEQQTTKVVLYHPTLLAWTVKNRGYTLWQSDHGNSNEICFRARIRPVQRWCTADGIDVAICKVKSGENICNFYPNDDRFAATKELKQEEVETFFQKVVLLYSCMTV